MSSRTDALLAELRAWGLRLPGPHSKPRRPGHDGLAVDHKTVYLPDGRP